VIVTVVGAPAPVYSSVAVAVGAGSPPNAKPTVCVPQPAKANLAVFKEPLVVQTEPSYSSVAPVTDGSPPPKANPAVCVPQPAK
jgi:hypothetical protein